MIPNNPFVLQAAPPLPLDSCPPFVASTLPAPRRALAGSDATILLPATTTTVPFPRNDGALYLIPGEGLVGVAYGANSVSRLGVSDGRSRNPLLAFSSLSVCSVQVDGRAARLFVDIVPRLAPDDTAARPIRFMPWMFLTTTSAGGRQVNITIEGTIVFGAGENGTPEDTVLRLLSYVASLRW